MSSLKQISARRAALIEQAAHQRAELGAAYNRFQRPVAILDRGYAVVSKIKSHPRIALGVTAALAIILVRRGILGKLAGIATQAAKVAMPVLRFWVSRK